MNRDRFKDLLDSRGSDLSAWPKADRLAAEQLIASDPKAAAALDRTRDLDTLIRRSFASAPDADHEDITSRILAGLPKTLPAQERHTETRVIRLHTPRNEPKPWAFWPRFGLHRRRFFHASPRSALPPLSASPLASSGHRPRQSVRKRAPMPPRSSFKRIPQSEHSNERSTDFRSRNALPARDPSLVPGAEPLPDRRHRGLRGKFRVPSRIFRKGRPRASIRDAGVAASRGRCEHSSNGIRQKGEGNRGRASSRPSHSRCCAASLGR